jgi:hypothetical protein
MSTLALRRGRRIPGGALSGSLPRQSRRSFVVSFNSRAVRNCQWQGPTSIRRATLGPCAVSLVQPALYAAQGAGRLSDEPDNLKPKSSRVSAFYYTEPRPIKHPDIGFGVAPGGPAVAGRRANAPPRRTGVPAAGEPKIGPGVRFFSDHPVPCRKGCSPLSGLSIQPLGSYYPTSERNPCSEARDGPLWSLQFIVALSISNDGMQLPCSMTL